MLVKFDSDLVSPISRIGRCLNTWPATSRSRFGNLLAHSPIAGPAKQLLISATRTDHTTLIARSCVRSSNDIAAFRGGHLSLFSWA